MTYVELDQLSNRVANHLLQQGLKLEESVAVYLPESCEFLAAILGVLKAGGTYFPIDVEIPMKRLEFLLNNSASRLVVSDAAGQSRLKEWPGQVLDVVKILAAGNSEMDKNPGVPSDPKRRAYITYTSGSTGQPKGVEIEHHSLTNLVNCYHRSFELSARDRASMLAYVGFDVSVADIWPVLCAGGIIVIPPRGILINPDVLIGWLAEEEITLSFVPTGYAEILFARSWPIQMKLRFLVTGGDRLRGRPHAQLPFYVINGYGPTENTVFCTWALVESASQAVTPPPIGRPLDNTTAYVLDEALQPVPVNVEGELYLGGEQIARGYLGRPELTAERFLPDPFARQPGARMYRTGDWVRWLPSGELDFIGRKDGQIQIRGRRVELGEIEASLFAHDGVRQVCCVPVLDEGMPSGLVAHVVPSTADSGLPEELRVHLSAILPDYMVPSEFVLHENLPLTPQGKLNRAALMAMPSTQPAKIQDANEDGLTKAIAHVWHTLLPAAQSSPARATFAALGGDSLLAIKLMLKVEEIIGQPMEMSSFLIKPTFAGLCEAVKERLARNEFEPVLMIRNSGSRPPLFCLYGYDGDIHKYFHLAETLGEDQPVVGIRSPALDNLSRLPSTMESAATEVCQWIRKIQPQGVPALAGYSWSGQLAFEVARQWFEQEKIHCYTALIGTPAPLEEVDLLSRLIHFIQFFPPWFWHLITDHKNRSKRLLRWREMAQGMKQSLVEDRVPLGGPDAIERHMIALMEKYQPRSIPDFSLELFRESDKVSSQQHPLHAWMTLHLPDTGWNRWTRRPNHVHWVKGDHESILKPPQVSALAKAIRESMDRHFKLE